MLAITYMHGSRRRLEASLRQITGLAGRYECSTLDSVALRWTRRWRALVDKLGLDVPEDGDFDRVCSVAARLLEAEVVRKWVTCAFPALLVDEAQDLTAERLAIVRALAQTARIFIAGDEFQCLQDELQPNPFSQWCASDLAATALTQMHRTDAAELLAAAAALRAGQGPKEGGSLKIKLTPKAPMAGAYVVNAVYWYRKGGTVAILAPSFSSFVQDAIAWAQQNKTSQGNGPIAITWERSEKEERRKILAKFELAESAPLAAIHAAIDALQAPGIASHVRGWIDRQRNALGRTKFARTEIEGAIFHALANRRRFGKSSQNATAAMSIHAAKNREFDGVLLLWPYKVGGTDDHKRRLLYNAITRARKWVRVLVQGKEILSAPPFK